MILDSHRGAALTVALALTAGCAQELETAMVAGSVTLDGQPLKDGLVKFVPSAGDLPTADSVISDGKYEAEVPVGKFKVQISAPKVIGKTKMYDTPDSPTVDTVEEAIPARYNVQSDLTIDVGPGKNSKDFALTTK